jgi:hypothetical protein
MTMTFSRTTWTSYYDDHSTTRKLNIKAFVKWKSKREMMAFELITKYGAFMFMWGSIDQKMSKKQEGKFLSLSTLSLCFSARGLELCELSG